MSARYVEYLGLPWYTQLLVYLLALLSVVAWIYGMSKTYREVGLSRVFVHTVRKPGRAARFLLEFLPHYRFLSYETLGGVGHLLLVVGLAISLVGTLLVAVSQYTGAPYEGRLFLAMRFLLDVAAVLLIYASVAGVARVYARRSIHDDIKPYILTLLGFLVIGVTGVVMRRYRAESYLGGPSPWSPLTYLLPQIPHDLYVVSYFIHIAAAFLTMAFSPVALRHMYIAYANFLLEERRLGELNTPFELEKVLESGEVKVGVRRREEWKGLYGIMFDACTRCGRCEEVCPAFVAKRPLSPMGFVVKIARARGGSDLFQEGISEDEVWSCTTCGACVHQCPVYIRHIDYIVDMRRALVFESRVDQKKADLLVSVGQYGNTLMQPNTGRHDWLRDLGVKHVGENTEAEYILWLGCMGSFDARSKDIVRSLVEILRRAGLIEKVAVLGDEETCCGDPLRRLGEESRFQEIVLNNKRIFEKYGVKKIITICPHGYNTFKNEYPRFGVKIEVFHHVEIIQKLLEEGKISVKSAGKAYTIHDPCYLARHNGVVQPQRRVLVKLGELIEPSRRGEKTFCCGAGGANYWYDVPEEKRISHIRFEELAATGASTVVTLCPFCNAMLSDAKRTKESPVEVKDIAEVVLEEMT
ncbi:(Fe-S)-binding protein [Pyrobaculum neutrophilum]|uniref:4Fe-4S ferredoxin-type domain-containing protein n=1 Tax=Pyrobaculum neutrophilum (strain DSM 2338 / JCM 9278 / NBRC 100436 / V24Sta) TaxID=444157 RepID=B1YD15_PYRNV|nr:heterodisulfide reductase-related iron-sulfur binding cluster [Pyrobaculum neutrophilum]ACB39678.1 protein of unknown function DUF224 cysteine-rich region domain protein [Pyrobaculum neutrophilum V24Sta]